MRRLIYSFTFISLLLSSACKKADLPKAIKEEPQIYVSGEINGNTFSIKAGQPFYSTAGSYCYTDDSLRSFVFDIFQADSNCGCTQRSMRISVNNSVHQASASSLSDIDKTIVPGPYSFIYSPVYPYKFDWHPSQVFVTYSEVIGSDAYNYCSINMNQNNPCKFIVKSVSQEEHYGKTYKVAEIEYSCLLYCPDNKKVIYIQNGQGRIAFGE